VVRALVSHQCDLFFNPVEAVMLVEFVVGSCDCLERVFSKDCSFYFLNIVISIFKFSQSREDKLPQ